ncbi:serine hydrolase [Arthrobacter sp. B1805]|uniref:serine hydrolase n=1 Tax=Arthrobacter sp. B1805 TaxID=2058892 RepID=UPI000CE4E526|nr:serine hydrolase [Arthrobacter sp. B1805]
MGQQAGRRSPSRRVRRMRTVWGACTALVLTLVVLTVIGFQSASPPDAEPHDEVPGAPVAEAPASLDDEISALLAEADTSRVGVALADVSGDATRTFGDETPFFAASTAKIISAAAFYHLVENGEASLDQDLGDYDAAFQIEAMVNNSSNDSWALIMDAVGHPQLTEYAASLGIDYDPEDNLLTAADMATVLKQLYAGDLLNQEDTAQLLGYMQETNNEDLIPAGSRPGITVHHKYGQVDGELHDAALLTYHGSTFALVIYTENTEGNAGAEQVQLIHDLTRVIEDALFAPDA